MMFNFRYAVEYDLFASTAMSGVQVANRASPRTRVDLTGRPTAVMWHPHTEDDVEDRFVVSNHEYKLKEFNADSKQCRNTTLAPSFGGCANKLLLVPSVMAQKGSSSSGGGGAAGGESQLTVVTRHYAYSTPERIIGLGSFPLSGSPDEVIGLVGHPGAISDIAVSFDGKFVFSAGGADLCVNMWTVDVSAFGANNPNNSSNESVMAAFHRLIEGGTEGELYNDITDYFYYCQVRSQGENAMEQRAITGRIPVQEIPSLMRAIGFYPSEEEIINMINEVCVCVCACACSWS